MEEVHSKNITLNIENNYYFFLEKKKRTTLNEKNELIVSINQVMSPSYGLYVWPSSVVLAEFVFQNQNLWGNKKILEIGCGTSLPGIVASLVGSHTVILSDTNLSFTLENCKDTLELNRNLFSKNLLASGNYYCSYNGCIVGVEELNWGYLNPQTSSLMSSNCFDFILGSDVFYDDKDFDDILATVSFIFKQNPSAIFYTAYEDRSEENLFTLAHLLNKWNMSSTKIELSTFFPPNSEKEYLLKGKSIYLFQIASKLR